MHAILCSRYGTSHPLRIEQLKDLQPGRDEIIVRNRASSVNPVDWKIRSGQMRAMTGLLHPPEVLGSDFAGVVEQVGHAARYPDGETPRPGDRVFGKLDSFKGGAYAACVRTPAAAVARIPEGVDFYAAAAVPNTALTAWQALFGLAGLQADQHAVINGASGGVGVMAVQIAKAHGARVTAVSSRGNHDLLQELGADVCVDYRSDGWLQALPPFDVFFDSVGRAAWRRVRKQLKRPGTYVRTLPSLETTVLAPLIRLLGQSARHIMVKPNGAQMQSLASLMAAGQLKAVVQQVFPAAAVNDAHRLSMDGHVVGKLVLDLDWAAN